MKIITVFLLAMILLVPLAFAQSQASSSFDVVLSKQIPYPAEPGNVINIEIEVQNIGFDDGENINIEILPEEPFRLLPGEDKKKTFSRIAAKSSVKIPYRLQVDAGTVTNDYELKFRIYREGSSISQIEKINVVVQGIPDLILNSVSIYPQRIEPSGIVDVAASIKNVGTGTARHVKVSIESESETLVPLLSGGQVFIDDLEPSHIKSASLRLKIGNSAEYKTYIAKLTLSYKDENGTEHSKTHDIGIPVTGSIQLDVIKIEPNIGRGVIKIEIANKGTTDAKSLDSKLIIGNETIGVDYTSQLKASKQTTLEFPLIYKGSGKLVIDYIGPGIEKNTLEKEIVLNFEEPGQDNTGTIVTVIVIIIIIVWYIRRRRKNKQKA
ncbi:MAG: hypothetical protein ISS36_00600 [Candidatus Aenigmarchaeota archaeon]|nr:hypothetical protein [Candidatus Aenigmarchaeota archaeon]